MYKIIHEFKPIFEHIVGTSIDDCWFKILRKVLLEGRTYKISSGSFEGHSRISNFIIAEMHQPWIRPLVPFMPEGANISPPTTAERIEKYIEKLLHPESKEKNEHYTYAEDLWWEFEEIVKYFKKYGFDNACCYMGVGRPESLFFYNRDVDYREGIIVRDRNTKRTVYKRKINNLWNRDENVEVSAQCLRGIDVSVVNNKLYFTCYFRSQDLYSGFPENYGGIQIVKEYMVAALGIEDGPLIAISKDLHVYDYAAAVAYTAIRAEPKDMLISNNEREEKSG
ncbi:MAG: thymidylate synthase [Candidatus Tagabacteria bacterium]